MPPRKLLIGLSIFLVILIGYFVFSKKPLSHNSTNEVQNPVSKMGKIMETVPTPTPTPSPSPTPKPLTFKEMNELYGPCIHLPVLMYHHVQDKQLAEEKKQTSISVYTDIFKEQLAYLKSQGYQSVLPSDLNNFFNGGIPLGGKSILITFDDGYDDFYNFALPMLKEVGFKAVVFLPTGLMENSGYMTWSQISDAASYGIIFGNHTWSHKNVMQNEETLTYEFNTADLQLTEKGLNTNKIFAYPYGLSTETAKKLLTSKNYALAFTTQSGSTACFQKRLEIPRIRIGNASLKSFGF
jgi:peptidoglycan/xylan/chitin deacetylase (PgdA/CDA1 family)